MRVFLSYFKEKKCFIFRSCTRFSWTSWNLNSNVFLLLLVKAFDNLSKSSLTKHLQDFIPIPKLFTDFDLIISVCAHKLALFLNSDRANRVDVVKVSDLSLLKRCQIILVSLKSVHQLCAFIIRADGSRGPWPLSISVSCGYFEHTSFLFFPMLKHIRRAVFQRGIRRTLKLYLFLGDCRANEFLFNYSFSFF